jgi:putative transcriptional regulator
MAKKVKYNKIKEILARQDVKQIDLADGVGKSRIVVNRYVNNVAQPSIETLFSIAKYLKVNPKDLINS